MDMRRGTLDQDHHIHLVTDPVVDHLRINAGKNEQTVLLSQRIDKNTDILKLPVVLSITTVVDLVDQYDLRREIQRQLIHRINKPEFRIPGRI